MWHDILEHLILFIAVALVTMLLLTIASRTGR
jgi:hypothetical protein